MAALDNPQSEEVKEPTPTDRSWVRYLPAFLRKRFQNRHVFQEAVENSGWLFADKILRMGVGLLVGVWVARYLGPADYGQINYAGSLVGLVGAMAGLGIDSIVIRDLVRAPEKAGSLLGTSFVLRLVAGTLCYLSVLGLVFVLRPDDRVAHILVAILGWILTVNAFDVIDFWFQSKVLSKYVVVARNVGFIVSAIGRVVLILTKASVISFAVMNLVEIAVGSLGLIYVYAANGGYLRKWKASLEVEKELLRNGWTVLLASVVSMVGLRIDQVILGQLADTKEVGIYASAVRIAELWFFIPSAIISSVFPSIVRAKEADEAEFYNRLQKLYNVVAFIGYAVAIPVTFLAGFVIHILYGKAYTGAAPILIVLIWSDLFINLAMARGAYMFTMNWTWMLLWVNVLGAVVNVALNFALIPHFGGMGAAVASLVSYWAAAHAACYLFKPLRRTGGMLTHSLLSPKFW